MKMNPLDPHATEPIYGLTRTRVTRRYALITSDGFVPSVWPGATGVETIFHITPAMGAGFVQARCTWFAGGTLPICGTQGVETFIYLLGGQLQFDGGTTLHSGDFVLLPPAHQTTLRSEAGAVAFVLRKTYEPLPGEPAPALHLGSAKDCPATPFLGHEGAKLQTLLPEEASLDLAVNIFTYRPGAFLPFVETHIMEHGLLMLSGHGLYRLANDWFPVRGGDVIWMAPYCPQWFVAMGEEPASYLYYKNVHRLPSL
jgi:(S)-ureidoglycine aminohydrolase